MLRLSGVYKMKKIKLAVILVLSVLALGACNNNYTNYKEVNEQKVETHEAQEEKSLVDKIKSKQKYIVVYKSFSGAYVENELSNFVEATSQDLFGKNYELKQQNVSFDDSGYFRKVILTFEYKGE